MASAVPVRIIYRGPGSLEEPAVPAPPPQVVQTVHMYEVGEEIAKVRPHWYLHEIGRTDMLEWFVELRPPGWDRNEPVNDLDIDDDDLVAE